jgi:hypothetical protein
MIMEIGTLAVKVKITCSMSLWEIIKLRLSGHTKEEIRKLTDYIVKVNRKAEITKGDDDGSI